RDERRRSGGQVSVTLARKRGAGIATVGGRVAELVHRERAKGDQRGGARPARDHSPGPTSIRMSATPMCEAVTMSGKLPGLVASNSISVGSFAGTVRVTP